MATNANTRFIQPDLFFIPKYSRTNLNKILKDAFSKYSDDNAQTFKWKNGKWHELIKTAKGQLVYKSED